MTDRIAVFVLVGIVALILVGPIITIWALNTLWPWMAIPLNVWTWLACVWFGLVIGGRKA